ncbi:MAG: ATP-dependent helicase [Planctomyces sp.]|nr:ATP-dependent helicase [Planctomyces sp.]
MSTQFHAKYFAHELTRQARTGGVDRLSMALFDACVDLNPHQIEAALFALRSPLSKGVILADEVGLGKTIEAGLVLCQFWAERKKRILVICPASLRKQWGLELQEKFNLPTIILDASTYKQAYRSGHLTPFSSDKIVITSYHFASRYHEELRSVGYDLVVIDEAHKLRNAYRTSNKMGQRLKWALEDRKKCLLTATPLQNSLMELYGLSTIIDNKLFGDAISFRSQYANSTGDLAQLRTRLLGFCHRTLRSQVVEYINYTARLPMTFRFKPNDNEHSFYSAVSDFLSRENTYSIPKRHRHLTALILRKLLASSTHAVANTLDTMRERLIVLRDSLSTQADTRTENQRFLEEVIQLEEIEDDYLDELEDSGGEPDGDDQLEIDRGLLEQEIEELRQLIQWARSIGVDTKSRSLIDGLKAGFDKMAEMGANRKALIFTESRRTQEYLKTFLEANGYAGRIVLFSGSNSDPDSRQVITNWLEKNATSGRQTGSRQIDSRTALIEHFEHEASIMIATEAAAEGVNMQFCSLVINYDLPWNPQRIEQRIGRCHRYGQKHDVVVINFLNEKNEADRRVHELLSEKFNLFNGIFGASDEVLGQIESGVDFEKRIFEIYQTCRTRQEIDEAFNLLQSTMEEAINSKMQETRTQLLEHFDEDVHSRLKMQLEDTKINLDRMSRFFWALTKYVLHDYARFDDEKLAFQLNQPPEEKHAPGYYQLISKSERNVNSQFLYRLSHPLGEWAVDRSKRLPTEIQKVIFDVTRYPKRLSLVEQHKGDSGWMILQRLEVESLDLEEYLLFSAFDSEGRSLDQEVCEKLFHCDGRVVSAETLSDELHNRLLAEADRHAQATIARSFETNNQFFNEERERLEKWAEDVILSAEKAMLDTKEQIKAVRRESRLASTLEEQKELQERLKKLERRQRKQRGEIFDIEDDISEKRDLLIGEIEKRLQQQTSSQHLFIIQWEVE